MYIKPKYSLGRSLTGFVCAIAAMFGFVSIPIICFWALASKINRTWLARGAPLKARATACRNSATPPCGRFCNLVSLHQSWQRDSELLLRAFA